MLKRNFFFKCATGKGYNEITKEKIQKDLLAESTLLICYLIFAFTRVAFIEISFTYPRALNACAQCEHIF